MCVSKSQVEKDSFWVHTSISLYAIYVSLPLAKLLYIKKKKKQFGVTEIFTSS